MFFDRGLRVISPALLIWVCACSVQLHESDDSTGSLELAQSSSGCLDGGAQLIREYYFSEEKKRSASEIGKTFDCFSSGIQQFREQTQGREKDSFDQSEILNFLKRFIIKKSGGLTEHELQEWMFMKKALIGGSAEKFAEFAPAQAMLAIAKKYSMRLEPYLPFDEKSVQSWDEERLIQASQLIVEAAEQLGSIADQYGSDYEFGRLEELLYFLRNNADTQKERDAIMLTIRQLPSLAALKAIFVSPDQEWEQEKDPEKREWRKTKIYAREWRRAAVMLAQYYSLKMRWSRFGEDENGNPRRYLEWSSGEALQSFERMIFGDPAQGNTGILGLLYEAVKSHSGTIQVNAFERLIDALETDELPGKGKITRKTMKNFLGPLFRRMVVAVDQIDVPRRYPGLDEGAVQRIHLSLQRWFSGQKYLERVFKKASRDFKREWDLSRGIDSGFSPVELISKLRFTEKEDWQSFAGLDSRFAVQTSELFKYFLQGKPPIPLFSNGQREVRFPMPQEGYFHSFKNLSELHWISELIRYLAQSYSRRDPKAFLEVSIQEPELQRFYEDVRQIGIEIQFFDPDNYRVVSKRFQEANLFMYEANGDDRLTLGEASQMVAFLISGKRLSNRIHEKLKSSCATGDWDAFGYERLQAQCFREGFYAPSLSRPTQLPFLAQMPAMKAYYLSLSEEQQARFRRDLEGAARTGGYSNEPIQSRDLESLSMILHYVEALFARFDRDHSGTLEKKELNSAFPVFKKLLSDQSCIKNNALLKNAFFYLLDRGQSPKGFFEFSLWKTGDFFKDLFGKAIHADRGKAIEVFSEVIQSTSSPQKKSCTSSSEAEAESNAGAAASY